MAFKRSAVRFRLAPPVPPEIVDDTANAAATGKSAQVDILKTPLGSRPEIQADKIAAYFNQQI